MPADATTAPAWWTLVTVGTLGSVALLSFLGGVWVRGAKWVCRGAEAWVLCVAVVCVLGDVVVRALRAEGVGWGVSGGDGEIVSGLWWVAGLLQILGIGCVKVGAGGMVLKIAVRNWHRHVILGVVCFTTLLTVFWFGSALLFSGPIAVTYSAKDEPESIWNLLHFISSILDVVTIALLAVLPLPLLRTSYTSKVTRITLLAAYVCWTATLTSAILRTYLLAHPSSSTASFTPLTSSIELTTSLLATSLLLYRRFARARFSTRTKHSSTPSPSTTPRSTSFTHHAALSTDTVIHHHTTAPSPLTLRFHDAESNLDFDMATLYSRAQSQTNLCPQTSTHSRNESECEWNRVSSDTARTTHNYAAHLVSARASLVSTNTAHAHAHTHTHVHAPTQPTPARRSRALTPHPPTLHTHPPDFNPHGEEKNRAVIPTADRGQESRQGIGVAVTTSTPDLPGTPGFAPSMGGMESGEGEGKEMSELAAVFADRGRVWGGGGSV